jgi:hypothetical protein
MMMTCLAYGRKFDEKKYCTPDVRQTPPARDLESQHFKDCESLNRVTMVTVGKSGRPGPDHR